MKWLVTGCSGFVGTNIVNYLIQKNEEVIGIDIKKPKINNIKSFKFIKFDNQGTGFHVFKYPDIKLNISYELKNTDVGVITATPVVRGSINDIYLYEEGSGYGSEILNLENVTSTIAVISSAYISSFLRMRE